MAAAAPAAPGHSLITDWTGIKERKKEVLPRPHELILPEPTRRVTFKLAPRGGGYSCFESREPKRVVYAGITFQMPLLFFPTYRYDRATFGPTDTDIKGGKSRYDRGKKFGTKIDNQMATVVKFMDQYRITIPKLLSELKWFKNKTAENVKRKAKGKKMKRDKLDELKKAIKKLKLFKYTKRFLTWMMNHNLHPVYSQLPVVCADGNMATAIDIVAVHTITNEIWLIELKTNYNGTYHLHTNNRMLPPFESLSDSPCNQHIVQALIGISLFKATYPTLAKTRKIRTMVLRAHTKAVDPIEIPQELLDNVEISVSTWKKLCRIPDTQKCLSAPHECFCTGCRFRTLLNSCLYIDL